MKARVMVLVRLCVIVIAACSLGSSTSTAASRAMAAFQAVANLEAYWAFEESGGTTAADSSGNGHTGTHTGGVAIDAVNFSPQPTVNNLRSISLDGTTGYVDVPSAASLEITGSMTLAAWVRPTSAPSHQMGIIEKWADPGTGFINGYFLRLGTVGTPVTGHYVKFNMGNGAVQNEAAESGVALPLNTWTHVAGVYNGTTMQVYKNGVSVGSASSGPATASGVSLSIGGYTPNVFAGNIDDARIYTRALSTAEIGVLMNGQAAPTGLVATPGPAQVTLSWTAAPNATNYNIYRAPAVGGPYVLFASTAGTSYTDTSVVFPIPYWYEVTAVSVMESAPAGPVTATALPTGPHVKGTTTHNLAHRCGCGSVGTPPFMALALLALSAMAVLIRRA